MTADQNRPQPKPGILDIEAYVPGKSAAPAGVAKVHKLSSNENPLGASQAVIEAVKKVAEKLEFYPDGASTRLREAIASAHGLNPANIVCSNGSDEMIGLLAQTYLSPGDEAIFTEHGFLVYRIYIQAAGATPVAVPETAERADVDAILAAVTDRTRIVFLANPNNPTGTYLPFEEVRRLHAGLPTRVLLVLDAAYAEYVRRNDYEAGVELVAGAENVVMTRTFSKIHGLAGLRLGWLYGPPAIIDALNRIRGPFNVNAPAIAAGIARTILAPALIPYIRVGSQLVIDAGRPNQETVTVLAIDTMAGTFDAFFTLAHSTAPPDFMSVGFPNLPPLVLHSSIIE